MIERPPLVLLAACTAAVLATTGIRAADATPAAGPAPVTASGTAAASLRPVERSFIVQGVENGRVLAELSRLAVSQATTSSVRDLAQQLVSDYGGINRDLEALARRKTLALPLQPTSYSDQYRDLAAVSGSSFDQAFIRLLASAATREFRLCESAVANARDADVRELAGTLLPTLRDHVNKSTELLKTL
jgi:predicted outer membrane protein